MSLRLRILLLGIASLSLLAAELLLGGLGFPLSIRILVALLGVSVIGWAAWREVNRLLRDLDAIRGAIDDTAHGQFERPIPKPGAADTEALTTAVGSLRSRLTDMGRRLVQSLRIESLNLLGSIVVHDMKNLSFRLRCLSQNLAANYDNPDFRDSLVRALDDTTEKMDQMVRRFREKEGMVIVKIRVNLNEVARSAVGNLQRDAAGIRISERYSELPSVWADPLLVENAIFNIASNACDAMPSGGSLVVRTQFVENAGNSDRRVVIDVADTGPGMTEEFIRDHLFTPFVTTKPRGLGLGLYTCQQIIQMHDGEVRVRSEPGRGTVFSIHLPITD